MAQPDEHAIVLYQCNLCYHSFTSPNHLELHKFKFHRMGESNVLLDTVPNKNNTSFECKYCMKIYATEISLYRHKCLVCSDNNLSAVQQKVGHGTSPNKMGNHGVKRKNVFMKMMGPRPSKSMRHSDSECYVHAYECDKCHGEFTDRDDLLLHQCIMYSVDEMDNPVIAPVPISSAVFKCGICNHLFPSYSELVAHENATHADKPYDCIICYESFSSQEVLAEHIEMHTGKKPWVCNMCEAIFLLPSFLEKHIRKYH